MSGRESLEADDGERRNFHRFARAPPATRRHAGHISPTATSQVTASLHDFAVSLAQARSSDEFARLAFTGQQLVPPGVVLVSEWRPTGDGPRPSPAEVNCYGGVGRKP